MPLFGFGKKKKSEEEADAMPRNVPEPNGTIPTYEGELKDGKYHGTGTLNLPGGKKYVGEFKDGIRDGQGTWTSNGYVYTGEFKDDKMHGQVHFLSAGRLGRLRDVLCRAILTYPRLRLDLEGCAKYVGEFKDGVRHGQVCFLSGMLKATMTYATGDVYTGEWKDDNWNGQIVPLWQATWTSANGNKYVGEFKDGRKCGQGTFTLAGGNKYVGEFKDDKMHGQGTFTWRDQSRFEGEWNDNNGAQGTWHFSNGTTVQGQGPTLKESMHPNPPDK